MRDLGRVDPWQESLQRSRARRARPASPEPAGRHRPPRRDRARLPTRSRRPGPASQSQLMTVGSWGVLVVTVIMVTVGGLVDGHGAQASADASRARSGRPALKAPARSQAVAMRASMPPGNAAGRVALTVDRGRSDNRDD